jgi:hypothetical protein
MFLTIDHVDGGGRAHRRKLAGNSKSTVGSNVVYRWLQLNNYPAGFRVLCRNCNYAEAHGGCPHQEHVL